jgi:phage gp36-like protein
MTYATTATIQIAVGGAAKLAQLTDDLNAAVVDAVVVAQCIEDVDGVINGMIGKRYAPSDGSRSPAVRGIAARMAARWLRTRRTQPLERDIDDAKDDRQFLEDVRDGKNVLTDDAGIQIERSEMMVDTVGDRETTRVTTRNRMKGFW